jgi:signal transduction histidine kinase
MMSPPLDEFVIANRDELIRRCRTKVASRTIPAPTAAEIDHGVPLFLEQLVEALRGEDSGSSAAIGRGAVLHGHDLLLKGFTVSQVVHDYGDVCQAITDLAVERSVKITADDFRSLNACLDDAIASAVTQYAKERDQTSADGEALRGSERLGFLAHELLNLLNTALLAFEALRSGTVGSGGSTALVLHRSLTSAVTLISRSLAEVRLVNNLQNREPLALAELIGEIASAASLAAGTRRIGLKVEEVEPDVVVEADRQVLTAVVMNVLNNAFKFTRPQSQVKLRVRASTERVLIEVEDECGGLPGGTDAELFRPFEQRGANRTGLGLGLAFSRLGIEANNGRIYARSLSGVGCVFTIDLPRTPSTALMPLQSS